MTGIPQPRRHAAHELPSSGLVARLGSSLQDFLNPHQIHISQVKPKSKSTEWREFKTKTSPSVGTMHRADQVVLLLQAPASKSAADRILGEYDYLLQPRENEDGDMAAGISKPTWGRFATALRAIDKMMGASGRAVPQPTSIDASENGALHVLWKASNSYALLIFDSQTAAAKWFVRTDDGEDLRGPLSAAKLSNTLLLHLGQLSIAES